MQDVDGHGDGGLQAGRGVLGHRPGSGQSHGDDGAADGESEGEVLAALGGGWGVRGVRGVRGSRGSRGSRGDQGARWRVARPLHARTPFFRPRTPLIPLRAGVRAEEDGHEQGRGGEQQQPRDQCGTRLGLQDLAESAEVEDVGQVAGGRVRGAQQQHHDRRGGQRGPATGDQPLHGPHARGGRAADQDERRPAHQDDEARVREIAGDAVQRADHTSAGLLLRQRRARLRGRAHGEGEGAGDRVAVGGDRLPGDGVRAVREPRRQPGAVLDRLAAAQVAQLAAVHPLALRVQDPDRVVAHRDALGEGERDLFGCALHHRPLRGRAAGQRGVGGGRGSAPEERAEQGRREHQEAQRGRPAGARRAGPACARSAGAGARCAEDGGGHGEAPPTSRRGAARGRPSNPRASCRRASSRCRASRCPASHCPPSHRPSGRRWRTGPAPRP